MENNIIYQELAQDGSDLNLIYIKKENAKFDLKPFEVLIEVKACKILNIDKSIFINTFDTKPKLEFSLATTISGNIIAIGSTVQNFKINDSVIGLLSLNHDELGCSNYCILSFFEVVLIPSGLDFLTVTATLDAGLKSYTALHYLSKISKGDTVLIMDACTEFGFICCQIAKIWQAKVIAIVKSQSERELFDNLKFDPDCFIEQEKNSKELLFDKIMKETGNLGVNVIIESSEMDAYENNILNCLSVGGRLITEKYNLQLNPSESMLLFLRNASLSFLFEQSLLLSAANIGKVLHIYNEFLNKLANGSIAPYKFTVLSFRELQDKIECKTHYNKLKKNVIQISS